MSVENECVGGDWGYKSWGQSPSCQVHAVWEGCPDGLPPYARLNWWGALWDDLDCLCCLRHTMALSIWCFLADHGFEIHCQIRWKCVHWWASRCLHKCSCSTCFQSQKFNSLEGQRFWRLLHRCHHQLILLVTCGWWLAKVLSCATIAKLLIGAPSCQWVTIPSSLDIMSLQGLHWQIIYSQVGGGKLTKNVH